MEFVLLGVGYVFEKIRKWVQKTFKPKKKTPSIQVKNPEACRDNNTAGRDVHTGDTHHHHYAPDSLQTNSVEKQKPPVPNPEYYKAELYGNVSKFDYSNNNGRYTLGVGDMQFTAYFSKASDDMIYVLSDEQNIKSVSISKTSTSWEGIQQTTDIFTGDTSSRCRIATKEKLVVWENENGYFMLMKITDIKDNTRNGADKDNVVFKYKIGIKKDGKFKPMIDPEDRWNGRITAKIGMKLYWKSIDSPNPAGYELVKGSDYPGHGLRSVFPDYGLTDIIMFRDMILCEAPDN